MYLQIDPNSHYSAHLWVVQLCLVKYDTDKLKRFGEYILKHSVSVRAVPELIGGEARTASKISTKSCPHFAHQRPDNVETYTSK